MNKKSHKSNEPEPKQTKEIIVTVKMGLMGCVMHEAIEVEADATDDDIEEMAQEAMFRLVAWSWKVAP